MNILYSVDGKVTQEDQCVPIIKKKKDTSSDGPCAYYKAALLTRKLWSK